MDGRSGQGAATRLQRDTRVQQNLPLRRRCLYLQDRGCWTHCRQSCGTSAAQLIHTHLRRLDTLSADTAAAEVRGAVQQLINAMEPAAPSDWAAWAEALESLLAHLEDVHDDASAAVSPVGSGVAAGRGTELEHAVRALLCDLIIHCYDAGRAYYAAQRDAARTTAHRKRSRTAQATAGSDAARRGAMRVTWSVAAPVAPALCRLFED